MEICSLCYDSSKIAYLNVETIQIGSEFISIIELTSVFKDLEQVMRSVLKCGEDNPEITYRYGIRKTRKTFVSIAYKHCSLLICFTKSA